MWSNLAKPIMSNNIEKFKIQLNTNEIAYIEACTGKLMKTFGDTKVIATGGLSKFAKPLKSEFNDIIPSLTLDGMLKILDDYEKE